MKITSEDSSSSAISKKMKVSTTGTRTSSLPRFSSIHGRTSKMPTRTSVSAGSITSTSSGNGNNSSSTTSTIVNNNNKTAAIVSSNSNVISSSNNTTSTTPSRRTTLRSGTTPTHNRGTPTTSNNRVVAAPGTPAELGSSTALLLSRIRKVIANAKTRGALDLVQYVESRLQKG